MKEKIKELLQQFGPISAVFIVALVAIFVVNGFTGFGPGGIYAPGGEKDVAKTAAEQEKKDSEKDLPTTSTGTSNGSTGSTTGTTGGTLPDVGSDGSTQISPTESTTVTGGEDGSGQVGFDQNGQANPTTPTPEPTPEPAPEQ